MTARPITAAPVTIIAVVIRDGPRAARRHRATTNTAARQSPMASCQTGSSRPRRASAAVLVWSDTADTVARRPRRRDVPSYRPTSALGNKVRRYDVVPSRRVIHRGSGHAGQIGRTVRQVADRCSGGPTGSRSGRRGMPAPEEIGLRSRGRAGKVARPAGAGRSRLRRATGRSDGILRRRLPGCRSASARNSAARRPGQCAGRLIVRQPRGAG
jgi:hypothetical protein